MFYVQTKLTILIVAAAMISIAISPTLLSTPVVKVLAAKGSSSSSNETSSSSTSVSSSGGFKKVQILDNQAFTYKSRP